jgi:hypothetical protein
MTTLESMRIVARHFNALHHPYAFLGAAVLPLLMDNPDLFDIRPTKDVDLAVKLVTLPEFYEMEQKLRQIGFQHDTRPGAPICRWIVEGVTVDVMPTESPVLGMSTRWFKEALEAASLKSLGDESVAPVISPPYFLATKLAAFRDRGFGDLYLSKDLEDIIILLDGCEGIVSEVKESAPEVRQFVAHELSEHIGNVDFQNALPGYFRSDKVSNQRMLLVRDRLTRLSVFSP